MIDDPTCEDPTIRDPKHDYLVRLTWTSADNPKDDQ